MMNIKSNAYDGAKHPEWDPNRPRYNKERLDSCNQQNTLW